MPELSILLPSLRPDCVEERIKEFAAEAERLDYELIIVSPFEVSGPCVRWIHETEARGCLAAMQQAYEASESPYIMYWSDDAGPLPGSTQVMLAFVKEHQDPFVGSFRLLEGRGFEVDQWAVYEKLYACWGCVSRRTLDMVGGLFDPRYSGYWADPDLGLRVWKAGGQVRVCPDAFAKVKNENDETASKNKESFFKSDTDAFFARWHEQYGQGRPITDWREFNCPVSPFKAVTGIESTAAAWCLVRSGSEKNVPVGFEPLVLSRFNSHSTLEAEIECACVSHGAGWYLALLPPFENLVSPLASLSIRDFLTEIDAQGATAAAILRKTPSETVAGVGAWKYTGQQLKITCRETGLDVAFHGRRASYLPFILCDEGDLEKFRCELLEKVVLALSRITTVMECDMLVQTVDARPLSAWLTQMSHSEEPIGAARAGGLVNTLQCAGQEIDISPDDLSIVPHVLSLLESRNIFLLRWSEAARFRAIRDALKTAA